MEHTLNGMACIGVGHMAMALLQGVQKAGVDMRTCYGVVHGQRSRQNVEKLGAIPCEDIADIPMQCRVILLAVKPAQVQDVLAQLAKEDYAGVIISVAAGITREHMQTWGPKKATYIRLMPNTPAAIGQGVSAIYAPKGTSENALTLARTLCESVGVYIEVEHEEQMNVVTALSGSGPAYFYAMAEELAHAAQEEGLPKEMALTLAVHTLWGAGGLVYHHFPNILPSELRAQVTSPGGTTQAGLDILAEADFSQIIHRVIQNATQRAYKISNQPPTKEALT